MLQKGNAKLGKDIYTWSIPAVLTCPGKTKLCSDLCYAQDSFFCTASVKNRLTTNYQLSQTPHFTGWIVGECLSKGIKVLRCHVAGDMYSEEYTEKWLNIAKALVNKTTIYLYTRSWRVPEIRPYLEEMGRLPNVQQWWSVDKETGNPSKIPDYIRLAYLQVDKDDEPKFPVDLVFRDYQVRKKVKVAKKVGGALVCPHENGINSKATCSSCKICFTDPKINSKKSLLVIK